MKALCLALVPCFLFTAAVALAAPPLAWKPADGPDGGPVFDLAVDPKNADVVFARGASTLLATRNGGESWELLPGPPNADPPGALRFDASGRARLVLTCTDWFRSADLGRTWAPAPAPDTDPDVSSAVTASESLYGAQLRGSPADPRRIYALTDQGLKVSRDRGATWTAAVPAPGQASSYRDQAMLDPRDANALVVATQDGIFRSADAGATWQPATGAPAAGRDGWSHLAVDPSNPAAWYAANHDSVLGSTDAGRTWSRIGPSPGRDVDSIAVAAPHRLYASCRQGVFRSADDGRSWQPVNRGITVAILTFVAADPRAPQSVYASAVDALYHSADAGASWQPVEMAARPSWRGVVTFDPGAAGTVYLGTGDGALRSVDAGRTWAPFGPPTFRAVAAGAQKPRALYAVDTHGAPQVSHSDGANWEIAPRLPVDRAMELGDALQLGRVPFQFVDPAAIEPFFRARFPDHHGGSGMGHAPITGALAPSDKRYRYLAWVGGAISRTEDGGATWVTAPAFPDRHVDALAVHPKNPRWVLAATAHGSIWMSVDGAKTWRDVGDGVRDLPVVDIVLLPTEPCTALLATRGVGIWRATLPALP